MHYYVFKKYQSSDNKNDGVSCGSKWLVYWSANALCLVQMPAVRGLISSQPNLIRCALDNFMNVLERDGSEERSW